MCCYCTLSGLSFTVRYRTVQTLGIDFDEIMTVDGWVAQQNITLSFSDTLVDGCAKLKVCNRVLSSGSKVNVQK